jgi:hypothetical protein
MLANRSDNYAVYSNVGRMDLSLELDRFHQLFSVANRAKFSNQILSASLQKDGSVDCRVIQTLTVELMHPKEGTPYTQIVTTRATDHWAENSKRGWELVSTRVQSQTFSTGPKLEDDSIWTIFVKQTPERQKR